MSIDSDERTDFRFAHGESPAHPVEPLAIDAPEVWRSLDDEVVGARFALAFDSGGES